MREHVYLVSGARTPIGRFLGAFAQVPAPDLGAVAIRAALERARVDPARVQEVIMGNVLSAGVGQAPARQAALRAGIPSRAAALTVNRVCASGLTAVVLAAQAIHSGDADLLVAGGMENMSLAPHLLKNSRTGVRLGSAELLDHAVYDGLWCAVECHHMGNAAEEIAAKYGIGREEQDAFALASHRRAIGAMESGAFQEEIAPVPVPQRKQTVLVERDETPRSDSSLEALGRLHPAFQSPGTVTAGNAPGLSDGAAALVVASAPVAERLEVEPLGRLIGYATANLEPRWLFDAPVDAVRQVLERTGRRLDDFDLIELNEAFAAQALANGRVLGWDWSRVNVNGGAVALGHPLGATGARILVTLLHALKARNLRRGLAVLCHGGGGAVAVAVERG